MTGIDTGPNRASAQDSPPWTPLPWKKSCASACSRFKASLLVSGERSALPSARPWRSFRTDTRPSRSSKDGSCSSSRRACFCTVPAGSHASRHMSLIAGVRPSIAVNGRNCCNVPPRPFGRATATEPTLTSFKLERLVQLPSFIWRSFKPQARRSSPRHWRRVLTVRLKRLGTLRVALLSLMSLSRLNSPSSGLPSPARCRCRLSWPACGRPVVKPPPGPPGPPMSTCAHFLTTSLTASSCTALLNGLRKQTCQGRLCVGGRGCFPTARWTHTCPNFCPAVSASLPPPPIWAQHTSRHGGSYSCPSCGGRSRPASHHPFR